MKNFVIMTMLFCLCIACTGCGGGDNSSQVQTQQTQITALQTQLSGVQTQLSSAKTQGSAYNTGINTAITSLTQTQSALATLAGQPATTNTTPLTSVSNQVLVLQSLVDSLSTNSATVSSVITDLNSTISKLYAQISAMVAKTVPMSVGSLTAAVSTDITVTATFTGENGKNATFTASGGSFTSPTTVTIADGVASTTFRSATPGTFNIYVVEGTYAGGAIVTITATPQITYSISGTIALNSMGLQNVIVALTGAATGAAITDASGNYSFAGLQNGSHTVTPAIGGYSFTPGNASVTVNNANVTGKDFTVNAAITFSCTTGDLSPLGRWCDNGNGTLRDMTTGLIWLKDAGWGGSYAWTDAFDGVSTVQNGTPSSLSDSSALGDWRLPTKDEFVALTTGTEHIRFSSMYKFTNVQDGYYWSSSSFDTSNAWFVNIDGDYVFYDDKGVSYPYVWPVRSGQ